MSVGIHLNHCMQYTFKSFTQRISYFISSFVSFHQPLTWLDHPPFIHNIRIQQAWISQITILSPFSHQESWVRSAKLDPVRASLFDSPIFIKPFSRAPAGYVGIRVQYFLLLARPPAPCPCSNWHFLPTYSIILFKSSSGLAENTSILLSSDVLDLDNEPSTSRPVHILFRSFSVISQFHSIGTTGRDAAPGWGRWQLERQW